MEFNRATLLSAFVDLGRAAWAEGTTIEIAIYDGSALMLTFDWRAATKDVDGVFGKDRDIVRRLAAHVAEARGWPVDWLNDGVKGFLSARDHEAGMKLLSGEFPSADEPGLRVFVPRREYLFAMKCRAMRLGGLEENRDIEDIRQLATEIGVHSVGDAIAMILTFYPRSQLQPKVQFGLEEILSGVANGTGKLS
jgi:hypothetical protein